MDLRNPIHIDEPAHVFINENNARFGTSCMQSILLQSEVHISNELQVESFKKHALLPSIIVNCIYLRSQILLASKLQLVR